MLGLLAVAAAGLLGGHSLAYMALVPSSSERAYALEATGHGYLELAAGLSGALLLMAALFWIGTGFLKGRSARPPLAATVLFLGTIQVIGFGAQEVLERLVVGASLTALVPVMLVGIPMQLLAAAVGALLIHALNRAGAKLADLLSSAPVSGYSTKVRFHAATDTFRSAVLPGGLRTRGPPLLTSN